MALLYLRAGHLTAKNGGFRPGQFNKTLLAEGGAADALKVQPYYKGDATVKGKLGRGR
jgi:hypothetical protein